MGWFSVEETTPPEDKYVLAYVPGFEIQRLSTSNIAFVDATHWMPLPPPPNHTIHECPDCGRLKEKTPMDIRGELNNEIKNLIKGLCLREGWGTTDIDLAEVIFESKEVYSEIGPTHRWYNEKTVVVQIEGKLIQYDGYHITGDNSAWTCFLEFDLSSVKFCEPYQVIVTKYRPIDNGH